MNTFHYHTNVQKNTPGTSLPGALRVLRVLQPYQQKLLLLFLLALLPRVWALADFVTYDEAYHWIGRTERFYDALPTGNWPETYQTGHPGVTVMWLGSLGLWLEQTMHNTTSWNATAQLLEHLAWMRLPSAILHALLVPIAYLLLRKLITPRTAMFTAMLWATSPFLIAHARLLHMDALLTDFVACSLLSLLLACQQHSRTTDMQSRTTGWWLSGSGAFAGLALLTKGPALILLPMAGLLLFWQLPAPTLTARLKTSLTTYLRWLAVALLVVLLFWPALWSTPAMALSGYSNKILGEGSNPFVNAQFFLGQTVSDPGPLFYPVSIIFRMTPVTLIGILLMPLVLRQHTQEKSAQRRILVILTACILFWMLVMTLGPKKFDRYLLPIWPLLLVLAATGWDELLRLIQHWITQTTRQNNHQTAKHTFPLAHRLLPIGLLSILATLLLYPVIAYHPAYLSYYNPLLGGGRMAQQILLIGWGEGNDKVGAYLRKQTEQTPGVILTTDTRLLEPFVNVPVLHLSRLDENIASYAVLDLPSLQRNLYPKRFATIQQEPPLHRITMHGIDYAYIYQLPRPYALPINAQFADSLHLHGVTITRQTNTITVTPSWAVHAPPANNYRVFLHLLDQQGTKIAQTDVPPGGASGIPTSAWQTGSQHAVPLPLQLPPDIPPGTYSLVMGLYETESGNRAPLSGGKKADPARAGPHALLLQEFDIPRDN
jgi:4-amino-4-deoxy-L-arabinose transferase-like glycosyltransferase